MVCIAVRWTHGFRCIDELCMRGSIDARCCCRNCKCTRSVGERSPVPTTFVVRIGEDDDVDEGISMSSASSSTSEPSQERLDAVNLQLQLDVTVGRTPPSVPVPKPAVHLQHVQLAEQRIWLEDTDRLPAQTVRLQPARLQLQSQSVGGVRSTGRLQQTGVGPNSPDRPEIVRFQSATAKWLGPDRAVLNPAGRQLQPFVSRPEPSNSVSLNPASRDSTWPTKSSGSPESDFSNERLLLATTNQPSTDSFKICANGKVSFKICLELINDVCVHFYALSILQFYYNSLYIIICNPY